MTNTDHLLAAHLKAATDILEVFHAQSPQEEVRRVVGAVIVQNRDLLAKIGGQS